MHGHLYHNINNSLPEQSPIINQIFYQRHLRRLLNEEEADFRFGSRSAYLFIVLLLLFYSLLRKQYLKNALKESSGNG